MSLFGYYGVSPSNTSLNWTMRLRSSAAAPHSATSPGLSPNASPTTDVFQYTLNALKQTASPTATPSAHQASWFLPMGSTELPQDVVSLPRAKVVGPEALTEGQYQVITDRGTLTFDKSASHTQPFANARVMWAGDQSGGDMVRVDMTPAEKKTLYKYMKQCLLNQQAATQQLTGDGQSLS